MIKDRLRHRREGKARLRFRQADLVIALRCDNPVRCKSHNPASANSVAVKRDHHRTGQAMQGRCKCVDSRCCVNLARFVQRRHDFRVHAAGEMFTGTSQNNTIFWRVLGQCLQGRDSFLQQSRMEGVAFTVGQRDDDRPIALVGREKAHSPSPS